MFVERVTTARAAREFAGLVPERAALLSRRLDLAVEPYWREATRELFLLRDGRRAVGRVAAVASRARDRAHAGARVGFAGWLECPDDLGAARALLEAAGRWLRERGYTALRGPLHVGLGEELGVLVEGFDRPPGPLGPWNAPHLPGLLDRLGLRVVREWHAYAWIRGEVPPPPPSLRAAGERAGRAGHVVYRPFDPARAGEEVARFVATYNAALAGRPDFVPLSAAEAGARIREIGALASERLIWLAEVDGEPAGCVVAVPAVDAPPPPAEGGAPGPRPLAALRALRAAFRQRRLERVQLSAIAVDPRFRGLHVGAQLLLRAWRAALDLGVREAELSGIDPDDEPMHHLLWRLGCRRIRRFRVYEQPLCATGPGGPSA